MTRIARCLKDRGYILRSGGAIGADSAFAAGADGAVEVWRPEHATDLAQEIASKYHPVWGRLNPYVRKLHGRNVFQVLGYDLSTPSEFLICWTPDGCTSHAQRSIKTGGTGTAISIAQIDAANQDHHGHTYPDNGRDSDLPQDVLHVSSGKKVVGCHAENDNQCQDNQYRPEPTKPILDLFSSMCA